VVDAALAVGAAELGAPDHHHDEERRRDGDDGQAASQERAGARADSASELGTNSSPRRARTMSQAPPAMTMTRLIICAWVSPSATSSLRRMNSMRKRSVPVPTR